MLSLLIKSDSSRPKRKRPEENEEELGGETWAESGVDETEVNVDPGRDTEGETRSGRKTKVEQQT
jgi:hypothetical protein